MKPQDLPYRPCVGIMVLNAVGKVWTGRRLKSDRAESLNTPMLWQMPQGGIDDGENAEPAARRELYEETGISSITLLDQTSDWLTYDLPPEMLGIGLKGKYRGQKQKWFAYRFEGDEREIRINPPPDGHDAEFDAWEWRDMEELPRLIVAFKRALYENVVARFRHLVT